MSQGVGSLLEAGKQKERTSSGGSSNLQKNTQPSVLALLDTRWTSTELFGDKLALF